MLKSSARMLIAAAAIGLAIGGAAAPIGVAQAAEHGAGHAGAHSTPGQQATPARQAAAARQATAAQQTAAAQQAERVTPDQKTGCRKYAGDSPQHRDCMAQ